MLTSRWMGIDVFIEYVTIITGRSASCSMALHVDSSEPEESGENQVNLPVDQVQEEHRQSTVVHHPYEQATSLIFGVGDSQW